MQKIFIFITFLTTILLIDFPANAQKPTKKIPKNNKDYAVGYGRWHYYDNDKLKRKIKTGPKIVIGDTSSGYTAYYSKIKKKRERKLNRRR